jgi:3-dehydroquinate synthase
MKVIEQSFSVSYRYPVFFTQYLFDKTNPCLSDFLDKNKVAGLKKKILFVIDKGVLLIYPSLEKEISDYFEDHPGIDLIQKNIKVPGGELVKNDQQYFEEILRAIDYYKIDRHSYLAAIGGGAVLDLAGYAAAVAHRGIRHIRVPTTVLSQNDSGVGVKNGINYYTKKNFLGTFATPAAVLNDAQFLTTLHQRDWNAGMAEAVKVALVKDKSFFEWLENNTVQLMQRDLAAMQELIFKCAALHLQHISNGDPFETGSSRPLDFGHWSAHKLEVLTDFTLRHGEAVSIGIALDVVYSHFYGWLSEHTMLRILQLLQNLDLPIYTPELENKELLKGLQEFREHLGGRLTVLQLRDIGKGENVHEMDVTIIRKAIAWLKQQEIIALKSNE